MLLSGAPKAAFDRFSLLVREGTRKSVEESPRKQRRREIALGVLAKRAMAVPRSVQAGGWSPFRDVYGCVVAKWLHATEPVREGRAPLRGAQWVEDPTFVRFTRGPSLVST